MATDYEVGDKAVLFREHQEAIIRYIGKVWLSVYILRIYTVIENIPIVILKQTKFAPDTISLGLELLGDTKGDNDGSIDNHKYFECADNKGLLMEDKEIKFSKFHTYQLQFSSISF